MSSASLKNIDPQDFLTNYWQQKPLLVRDGFSSSQMITKQELMALAGEEDAESRLISNSAEQINNWQVRHGPFNTKDFKNLPKSHWTLLVQAVDHWVETVNESFSAFKFLPRWRMDDMMISFAVDGGGVGPHYDQYDVFLIQLSGKRHWRIGQQCDDESELLEDLPVKVLAQFDQQEHWLTQPGDVLYVPPGFAHWSESEGESLTLSVGFRAPAESEFITEFGYFLADQLSEFDRYQDPKLSDRSVQPHSIQKEDVQRLQQIIQRYSSEELLAKWLGRYMTEPKYQQPEASEPLDFDEFLSLWQAQPLYKNPTSRLAYFGTALFADGEEFQCKLEQQQLELICSTDVFEKQSNALFTQPEDCKLMFELFSHGVVFFDGD